jgi:hypothetical protein
MGAPPCNCHCSLEAVDDETANRGAEGARAASLAVRQAKAERRSSKVREFESSKVEETGRDVSRKDAKARRLEAARAAVMRELAERRGKG